MAIAASCRLAAMGTLSPIPPARFFTLCKFDLPNQRFGVSLMKKSGAKNFICAARTSFAALWKDITDGT